jgi:hypothetical protein
MTQRKIGVFVNQPVLTYNELTAATERGICKYLGEAGTSSDDFDVQAQAQSAQKAILELWRNVTSAMVEQAADDFGLRRRVEADDTRLEGIVIPF